jgi:magnesium transporter
MSLGLCGLMGVMAYPRYNDPAPGGGMAAAMMLNLLVAAMAGYFAPALIDRFGRDPAFGTAVLTTFITDSMGFFILLCLATVVPL